MHVRPNTDLCKEKFTFLFYENFVGETYTFVWKKKPYICHYASEWMQKVLCPEKYFPFFRGFLVGQKSKVPLAQVGTNIWRRITRPRPPPPKKIWNRASANQESVLYGPITAAWSSYIRAMLTDDDVLGHDAQHFFPPVSVALCFFCRCSQQAISQFLNGKTEKRRYYLFFDSLLALHVPRTFFFRMSCVSVCELFVLNVYLLVHAVLIATVCLSTFRFVL